MSKTTPMSSDGFQVALLRLNARLFGLTARFGQGTFSRYLGYVPRLLARLLRPQQGAFLFSTYGVWLTSQANDRTFKMCVDGSYGPFYLDYVANLPKCVYLDIGSNIGLYSMVAGRNRNVSEIYSFEPNIAVYDFLKENIARNGLEHATPVARAISSETGKLVLKTFSGHSGKSSLRDNAEQDHPDGEIVIETANHEYLNELLRHVSSPIAIKIDVEGHEVVVIETLRKSAFWKYVFSLYFEVDERYIDVQRIIAPLEKDGFVLKAKNGDKVHYDLLYERNRPL